MDKWNYKQLVVWQRAIAVVPEVYQVIKQFPPEETYALGDQMRRSAVSIAANIAEGQARQHRKEFLQHLAIAKGSLAELQTLLTVAHRLGYLDDKGLRALDDHLSRVSRPLHGLMQSLRQAEPPRTTNHQPRTGANA